MLDHRPVVIGEYSEQFPANFLCSSNFVVPRKNCFKTYNKNKNLDTLKCALSPPPNLKSWPRPARPWKKSSEFEDHHHCQKPLHESERNLPLICELWRILYNITRERESRTESGNIDGQPGTPERGGGALRGHFPCPLKGGLRGHRCRCVSVSQVISWFIKINLKQIYCSYLHTPKI